MRRLLERQFRTFIRLNRWRREHLTGAGNAMLAVAMLSIFGIFSLSSPLIPLFWTVVAALLTTTTIGWFFRPVLKATLDVPAKAERGERIVFEILLENLSRWPAFEMFFQFEGSPEHWREAGDRPAIAVLGAGETGKIRFHVRPLKRGSYPWAVVRCSTEFPLRLVRWRQMLDIQGELLVLPAFRPLHEMELFSSAPSILGEEFSVAPTTGESTDYLGAREYQEGVPVRRWDYACWARTGKPAVREYEDSQHGSAAILIDPFYSSAPGEEVPAFEAMLSLAAALAEATIDGGRHLNSVYLGDQPVDLGEFAADQVDRLLEALAIAAPSAIDLTPSLSDRIDAIALEADAVYCLFSCWDASRERLCNALNQEAARVVPLVLGTDLHGLPAGVAAIDPARISVFEEDL
ncbi:DUF58 domain-containing protein [Lignipirellula cremea]|uniref:DUF58 domain-containing protein n=1 Tax=Lignipirellula cremea TaxID=2528010 RepID=A0A518DME8_9BACT|nr:DUF58 domain-containing protein [Lignipirellula cremea]QDU93003.1 hypothetical protein Pla8534_07780 [Lignipirellula cremea]